MNNLEKEYIYLSEKLYGKDDDVEAEDYQTWEQCRKNEGGIVSVEEKDGDLIYKAADGFLEPINMAPRLYDLLVATGDIAEVELTEEEKTNVFADPVSAPIELARVREYIKKVRAAIATEAVGAR